MKATYKVGGMTCDGCVRAVTRALQRRDPKSAITVELASGKVSVDGELPRAEVQRAVVEAGFSFEG